MQNVRRNVRSTGFSLTAPHSISALALLLPLFLTACQPPAGDGKTKSLADAVTKYNNRELEEAEAIADQYIDANPSGQDIDEAYYIRGLTRFTRGSRPLAALDLKQALAKTTRTDLKAKAHRALGDIEFESQDWPAAQADYQAALATGALNADTITTLNYRIGICLQSQGIWAQAQAWFVKVAAAKNNQALTERAVARMDAQHFSLQFGAFIEAPKARDLVNDLKAAAITATIDSELREGQLMYLVRSGTYPTWSQAAEARDKLLPKYPLVAIVP